MTHNWNWRNALQSHLIPCAITITSLVVVYARFGYGCCSNVMKGIVSNPQTHTHTHIVSQNAKQESGNDIVTLQIDKLSRKVKKKKKKQRNDNELIFNSTCKSPSHMNRQFDRVFFFFFGFWLAYACHDTAMYIGHKFSYWMQKIKPLLSLSLSQSLSKFIERFWLVLALRILKPLIIFQMATLTLSRTHTHIPYVNKWKEKQTHNQWYENER